jgi:hypothetical protein
MFCEGVFFAQRKPLWADEIWTQVATVEKFSYWEMLSGQMKNKGGNMYPLPVIAQKALGSLQGFSAPASWKDSQELSYDARAMRDLRILPVFFMSVAMAMVVRFLFSTTGFLSSIIALLLFLSSYMAIQYWVEARFYALWFLLSSWQLMTLIKILEDRDASSGRLLGRLILIHVLLSLTVIFSVIQIGIAAILMAFFRKRNLTYHFLGTLIPCVIAFFYYFTAENPLKFWFPKNALDFIGICFPFEWMGLLVILSGLILGSDLKQRNPRQSIGQLFFQDGQCSQVFILTLITILFLGAGFVELLLFKIKAAPRAEANFPLYPRYFFYLTPVSLIILPMLIGNVIGFFKNHPWILAYIGVVIIGFLGINFMKCWSLLLRHTYYWNI